MDNRHNATGLPEGYLRNAVNVQFSFDGKAARVKGATKRYSGSGIHSYWNGYFIEGTSLKRLNSDYTATALGAVGADRMGFAEAGGRLFCGNGRGFEIVGNTVQSLGVAWPEQQPNLKETATGGLFAGTYQVAITYLRNGEESGCGVASTIEVSKGSGITFTMPTVPSEITDIAVWVSSVNGDELFLYGEYPAYTTNVYIENQLSSIRLETQFMYPPTLSAIVAAHYGRLYWAEGNLLKWTEPLKYGLTKAGNYAAFEGDISLIISLPGALYVCADKTYQLGNIDGEGFMQRTEVLPYGAVPYALHYDDNNERAFLLSHKGVGMATPEGVQEMVQDVIAMPQYGSGALSVTQMDGEYHVIAVGQGGTVSPLMDREFRDSEITRKGNAL